MSVRMSAKPVALTYNADKHYAGWTSSEVEVVAARRIAFCLS